MNTDGVLMELLTSKMDVMQKMIDINPDKEPEIYDAIMHKDDPLNHGAIVENAMVYPTGEFDFNDSRITEKLKSIISINVSKKY
jgi:phosphoenolpyruvate carboxykinase (ATP)